MSERSRGRRGLLVFGLASLVTVAVLVWLVARQPERNRQEEVAARGSLVMPFDLERTTHVFDPSATGGVQTVVADAPADPEQVELIRAHLREEARAFRRGDFEDPARIHGEDMPGLAELRQGAHRIAIRYTPMPDGARLTYQSDDPELVQALHDWFAAQVMDHGEHAEAHE